jgi:ubiquinone biosynthesis protein COQ4
MSIEPLRAWRALRTLYRDPDDSAQVFALIEALTGVSTPAWVSRRLAGSRISRERPEILEHLVDRDSLGRMGAGSLAHAYLRFVECEGITAEGLRAASDAGENDRRIAPELEYFRRRMRDTHDLWHAVLGYGGDVLGEASVLAFTFAQARNAAIGVLVLAGLARLYTPEARRLIFAALVRGLRAASFPVQEWETLLPLPLEEVRRRLRVGAPPAYVPVRSSDLR